MGRSKSKESTEPTMANIPRYRAKKPYYENRELSWLKFNQRVIEEALDQSVPLCERLSFTSIFQSNMDEFFMVRVGSLHDQALVSPNDRDNKTKMTAQEQLKHIFKFARELTRKKDKAYKLIMAELKEYGIELTHFNDIASGDTAYLEQYFKDSVMPLLSPQVVGKKQPFPFVKNREIYAVALLGTKNSEKVGLIPCSSSVLKRLVPICPDGKRYVLVEELILHFMPEIFDRYQIKSKSLIRIIRNADIDVDEAFYDEDLDYRASMEELIRQRRRLCPVRMEYSGLLDEKVIKNLCRELELKKEQIYYCEAPLELSFVSVLQDALRDHKELFYERKVPQLPVGINLSKSMIEQVEQKDRLIHYPYESMQPFLYLLDEAGKDDRVISIKMTLYRVAKNSQVVEALIRAAEHGKEVVVLVELRARFDEENNIEWSRRLEEAGCRIIYGIDFIKVHSKLCLITYREKEQIRYITQVGTGNFNEKTAKYYTDLSLITANQQIGSDAVKVFTRLCMGEFAEETEMLLVAPEGMKDRLLAYMDEEIALAKENQSAYIGIKMNALTDKKIIDKLIECSKAGVQVELIIRGICCLVPQIEGYTDNISVISIVGRYLEHSRIYIFGTPNRDHIYISSADFMTRNMEKRVEIAAPVLDESKKERIRHIFRILCSDTIKGRVLMHDGNYVRKRKEDATQSLTGPFWNCEEEINAQEYFIAEAHYKAAK